VTRVTTLISKAYVDAGDNFVDLNWQIQYVTLSMRYRRPPYHLLRPATSIQYLACSLPVHIAPRPGSQGQKQCFGRGAPRTGALRAMCLIIRRRRRNGTRAMVHTLMAREYHGCPPMTPKVRSVRATSENHRHCCHDIAGVEARMEGEGHTYRSPFRELTGNNPKFDSVDCA